MSASQPPVPHFVKPLLETPFHERARALSQVDSFIPWAGYTTVDVFTTRRAGVFRDPQRGDALRSHAHGEVPDHRRRCAAVS